MVAGDILIACTIEALDTGDARDGKDIRRIDDFDVSEQIDNPIAVAADNPIAVSRANIELLLLEKLIDDVSEFIPEASRAVGGRIENRDISEVDRTGSGEFQRHTVGSIGYIDGASIRNGQPREEFNRGAVGTTEVSREGCQLVTTANLHLINTRLGREDFSIGHDDFVSSSSEFIGA